MSRWGKAVSSTGGIELSSDHSGTPGPVALWEYAFVIAAFVVFSKAFLFIVFSTSTSAIPTDASTVQQGEAVISQPGMFWVYTGIYLLSALLVLPHWRRVLTALFQEKFLLLLLVWASLSVLWSVAPMETLVKSTGLVGCTLFGLYIALRFKTDVQLKLFGLALALIIVSSVVMAVFLPNIAIMQGFHEGVWRGALLHKNHLGRIAVLGGIVFLFLATRQGRYRMLYWGLFWMALFVLSMSCSKSSLLSWIIIFSLLSVYFSFRRKPRWAGAALASVALVLVSFTLQYHYKILPPLLVNIALSSSSVEADDLPLLGQAQILVPKGALRDTAGGRVQLWRYLLVHIQEKPVTGYGLGAFWRGEHGPSANVWQSVGWRPPNGHNGYIDLLLDLGAVGLILILLGVVMAGIKSIVSFKTPQHLDRKLPMIVLMVAILLANVAESSLVSANNIMWILFVVCVINLGRPSGEPASPH
ncbi:MAG: exopolysaccharide production protein ExoQ [Halioglobus sp.]|jgi:exopolysaccharide production protein ExoQ